MYDPQLLEQLVCHTACRTLKLLALTNDRNAWRGTDLLSAARAECWLEIKQGTPEEMIARNASNRLRAERRTPNRLRVPAGRFRRRLMTSSYDGHGIEKRGLEGRSTVREIFDALDNQLDARRYRGVLEARLTAEELALLEARFVREVSFEDLAQQSFDRRHITPTEDQTYRECARLRQVVKRLRTRAATALQDAFPTIEADIACWN